MDFNEEIRNVLNDKQVVKIVEFPLIFKSKLKIGDKPYKFLTSANNLNKFMTIIFGGGSAGGLAGLIAWFLSLGLWGQILFLVSLVSPYTWILIGAGLGVGSYYVLQKSIDKVEGNWMDRIPKCITTPIDVLGLSVVDIMCIPAVKIASCDGDYSICEKEKITDYFVKEWGINRLYIEKYQALTYSYIDVVDYNYIEQTKKAKKHKDFKYVDLKQLSIELVSFLEEVAASDGKISECEASELKKISNSFGD